MAFKILSKKVLVAVVAGLASFATAQINFKSTTIQFRDYNTAGTNTTHYGDLTLSGVNTGLLYGWLTANKVYSTENIHADGDLIVSGVKNFIHPHPTDTTKVIKYIATEAGEAQTTVRGTAKTKNGTVTVTLPEHFNLVTSDKGMITVQLTVMNKPALIYTTAKSKEAITVAVKGADFTEYGDVEFDYAVTGVRDGFENTEVIVDIENVNNSVTTEKQKKFRERVKKVMNNKGKK